MAKSAPSPPGRPRRGLVIRLRCGLAAALGFAAALGGGVVLAPAAEAPCATAAGDVPALPVHAEPGGLETDDGHAVILAGIARIPLDVPSPGGDQPATAAPLTEPLRLIPTAPPDRYGRTVGLVLDADGRLVQAALVDDGLAVVRPGEVDEPCSAALLLLEAAARRTGSGFWADSSVVAKATDATSLSARNGLYALVQGRIVSVGYGSRMVFLDFGRSFRTDFTVLVQQTLVPRLREAGIPVESLEGREVRVRGIIEESGGPAIRLASPLALELVDQTE